MNTTLTTATLFLPEFPRLDIDFFVPEVTEYYLNKERAQHNEADLAIKPRSFEEEILRYATVCLW